MADHRESEGQIKPCWEESSALPSHEDLGKSVWNKVVFCHFRQLLLVPQSSPLLCNQGNSAGETAQKSSALPFSWDFGCWIGSPGPQEGWTKVVTQHWGQKCSCHSVNVPWELPKEQSLVLWFGSLGRWREVLASGGT